MAFLMMVSKGHVLLWSVAFVLLGTVPTLAADFSGPVVGVLDGDTIEVLNGHHTERIRLSGIDCPEKGQAYGQNAKQAASALVFGKEVTIQMHGYDKYKRTLADVLLPDGTNVNHELVKAGWCWWYRKYAPGDTELERLEVEARDAKKGLWADPAPIPPWEVRHPKPGRVPLVGENLMSEGMDNPATTPTQIIGNRNSHIYHRPDCPSYTSTKPKNRVIFGNAAEAEAAGYRLAANCP